MTGPIKPPGSTPPISLPEVASRATKEIGGTRFREALDAQKADASRAPAPVSSDAVVTGLREGKLDASSAVDALVTRALESDEAKGLTKAGRIALEQHLRTQLAEDPAFARLVKDLG